MPDPADDVVIVEDASPYVPARTGGAPGRPGRPDGTRPGVLVAAWSLITVVGIAVVLTTLGPITEQRDQRQLLEGYAAEIDSATQQAFGLPGLEVPTQAPSPGAPVGILDLADIEVRGVVLEGTTPEQTRSGPGHVVGTAGLGQPGNSVVVGRHLLFDAPFADLDQLVPGDRLLVTTTQGQSVYEVGHVGIHQIVSAEELDAVTESLEGSEFFDSEDLSPESEAAGEAADPTVDGEAADPTADGETSDATDEDGTAEDEAADPAAADEAADPTADGDGADDGAAEEPSAEGASGEGDGAEDPELLPDGPVTPEQLYGPSTDDRLTLVTSASAMPWASEEATVVVATLDGVAFAPTPQGGRTEGNDGRQGSDGAVAPLLLALLAYGVAVAAAVWFHRAVPWRSAYLISAPLLLALTVVLAEQLAMALPAWA